MSAKIPHFETMEEPELNYIKVPNYHIRYVAVLDDTKADVGR